MDYLTICVLVDNRMAKEKELQSLECEHGLSFYFEVDNHHFLLDTGASRNFSANAEHLGISISKIDTLLLSHGHNDHTGGISEFLDKNNTAKIFASENLLKYNYFSSRHTLKREIGIDKKTVMDNPRFVAKHTNMWLTQHVAVVFPKSRKHPLPQANKFLSVADASGERLDNFDHEMAVVIKTSEGLIILSPCSHNGVLNIIDDCKTFAQCQQIKAFIGGMHLVDGFENKEEIVALANQINRLYPNMRLISGHCTGEEAIKIFTEKLNGKFSTFYCGWNERFVL